MLNITKAKMAALMTGILLALAGGTASSVTFSYPSYHPTECSAITIATSGAISCTYTPGQPTFTISSPLGPCPGLAITAAGAVSCAMILPEACILTASKTTVAPGEQITLTASGCTQTPTSYAWTGSGLSANSTTAQNNTVTLPATAKAGPYPYSVTASNAVGAGTTVETIVNVAITGYKGPFAYIAHQLDAFPAPGTLSVVDTTTNAVSASMEVKVGVSPVGVAVNLSGSKVYVANSGDDTVSVIDTANNNQIVQVNDPNTNSLVKGIGVGSMPWGIAVNPSGTRVYVANSGNTNANNVHGIPGNSVSVIDAVSNAVIKTVTVGTTPYGVAVNPAGSKVYVTNYGSDSVSVIDTNNNTLLYPGGVANGLTNGAKPFNKPYGVAVDPAGNVYVANEGDGTVPGTVSVINAANDTVGRQVTVGKSPRGVAVNPAGTQVYVVNYGDDTVSVIDTTTTNYNVTTLDSGGGHPNYIAFNPAGTLAYVTHVGDGTSQSGVVSVIDAATFNPAISAVPVGAGPFSFGNFVGPAINAQAGVVTTGTVVEFYNTKLDNYFITADPAEAAAIDNGSAGPGWSRTGNTFKSGGSTPVCRFYGSQSPGPNSHFYTVDAAECQSLKGQQIPAGDPRKLTEKSWNFESLDFVSTPPATGGINGTCPSGTTPVYRAYNNGFSRGVDSNHRITSSTAAIQEVVNRGWKNEGVVMCAPN